MRFAFLCRVITRKTICLFVGEEDYQCLLLMYVIVIVYMPNYAACNVLQERYRRVFTCVKVTFTRHFHLCVSWQVKKGYFYA